MKYNYTFGILSALGIIFVVLGHLGTNILTFNDWIPYYSFHMQLFLFISGYFFNSNSVCHVKDYIVKKIKRLLIPFYIWNFVYLSIQTLLRMFYINGETNVQIGNSFSIYNFFLLPWVEDQPLGFQISTWFVIALFLVEIYNIVLQWICSKIKLDNEIIILCLSLLISLLGIFFIQHNVTGILKICSRSMYCLFFYRLGCWYKTCGEAKDKMNSTLYFSILLGIQFVFRIVFPNLNIGVYGGVNFDYIPVLIITPIVGVFFWLRVAKLLTPLLKDVKWFIYIGKNTMSVMIHHLFAIFIIQAVLCFIHCNTSMLSGFDVARYASSVYYVYAPNPAMKLIYAILSIAIILLVVHGVEQLKMKMKIRK